MVEKIPFVLGVSSRNRIEGDFRYRRDGNASPVVLILHSFMAFKDWGWFPYVAEEIADAGFATAIFNFSANGVRENLDRITDFEAFERNTISRELGDIDTVLHAIENTIVGGGHVKTDTIILLGHSRGGGEAIVTSVSRRGIKGVITWSSVATFDRWTEHQKEQWRKLAYLPLALDSSASPLRLGLDLLNDVEKNKEKLDIVTAATKVDVPWLIIHGTEDLMVRFSEAEQLYAAANKEKTEFVPMKKVGHIYGGAEVTENSAIRQVVSRTLLWLEQHFS